jgi:hypothetical protein
LQRKAGNQIIFILESFHLFWLNIIRLAEKRPHEQAAFFYTFATQNSDVDESKQDGKTEQCCSDQAQ